MTVQRERSSNRPELKVNQTYGDTMKVLIVEDEARVARFIRNGLKEAGHQADIATDAEQIMDIKVDGKYGFFPEPVGGICVFFGASRGSGHRC